jgi:hypothetical protein
MTKIDIVISPSNLSQEHFFDFENHTRGIGSNFLMWMGDDGQYIGKRSQGVISSIIT